MKNKINLPWDEIPLTPDELLPILKKGKTWLSAARQGNDGMPFCCNLITFKKAWKWMEDHPDFRVTPFYGCSKPKGKAPHLQPVASDKRGELSQKRGQRTASPLKEELVPALV